MLHRFLKSSLISIVLIAVISGCGQSRDLSTPASRFVGHWQAPLGEPGDYFVTSIDTSTGIGFYISMRSDGKVKRTPYKIINQDEKGERLVTALDYDESGSFAWHFVKFIAKDGQTLRAAKFGTDENSDGSGIETATHTYIDNKTEP